MEGVTPELFANKLAHQLAGKPIEFLLEELREKRKGELEIRTRTQTKLKHSPPFARNIRSLGAFSKLATLQKPYGDCLLLDDADPHYCLHHHSASVPLCCLLPVSLTAVSQAPAY
ncbi:hypothetical protein Q8A73_011781 [Channa argus]|nr:hypothetical protein Q8A73_011781 [Channa argus]